LDVSDAVLTARKATEEARGTKAYTPKSRTRVVSKALQAYAAMVTSADTGAVRDVSRLG
jgi:dihydroxy-acid dehydratase